MTSASRERSPRPYGQDFFFIGIDFGTTNTKVAWAYSKRPSDIHVVQSWPNGSGLLSVPSTIRYHLDGRKLWGHQASKDDPDTIQWFKLLLVDVQYMPESIRSSKYTLIARGAISLSKKSPEEVVKDYLALVWEHTVDNIVKHLGEDVVEAFRFRVVLTVPATWFKTPNATAKLEAAAKQAGITAPRDCGDTKIHIVSEPEAAAFAILRDSRAERSLARGDMFIMLDAGGGTVDLITYEMEDPDRMAVKERVEGDGDVCGSIKLDEAMEKYVAQSLGRRWNSLSPRERNKFKNSDWNAMKCNFDGSDTPHFVEIGKPPKMNIGNMIPFKKGRGSLKAEDGGFWFRRNHMVAIFSSVEGKIMNLIAKQVEGVRSATGRTPKWAIIMVGGLGGNKYLRGQIKAEYRGTNVIQRDDELPVTAICRGAVAKAMAFSRSELPDNPAQERIPLPVVTSRVARLSYGISYFEPFDDSKHNGMPKVWDEPSRKHIVKDLMHWLVKQGENVQDIDRPTYSFRRYMSQAPPNNRFDIEIWSCSEANPPESKRDRANITLMTTVLVDLGIAFEDLPRCANPGYREVVFQLDFVPEGPLLKFEAKINGVTRGSRGLDMAYAP